MVPMESAIGNCSMSSIPPPFIPMRDGGMWTIPVVASLDATKPIFQSFRLIAADEEGLVGEGRLGS